MEKTIQINKRGLRRYECAQCLIFGRSHFIVTIIGVNDNAKKTILKCRECGAMKNVEY